LRGTVKLPRVAVQDVNDRPLFTVP
jgi:hypothetical protein